MIKSLKEWEQIQQTGNISAVSESISSSSIADSVQASIASGRNDAVLTP